MHVRLALPAALLVLAMAAFAAPAPEDPKVPVPRLPNARIVDYGSDMGSGVYRGHMAQLFSGPGGPAHVDVDGDGKTDDDSVSGWEFSLTKPLSPTGAYYNREAPSGVYYGGIIGYHANQPRARLTEGMLNENHELRDDCNMMSSQGAAGFRPGRFVQAWGLWFWKKEDFLSGGDAHRVTFDDDSLIAVHITRYWDDVDAGRWVVRDGEQFYMSRPTFGSAEDIKARGAKTRITWTLHPARTQWAAYNPSEPFEIAFDPKSAKWADHTFRDVTAAGFYIAKDSRTPGVVGVKWSAFEAFAVVDRPSKPCYLLDTVPVGKRHFSKTEVPYAAWKRIYTWAVSNQYCMDLDQRPYVFDRDGDMGSMDLGGPHRASEPVTDVTWLDAVLWCNALSEYEGRTPCYYADPKHTRPLGVIRDRADPKRYDWTPAVYLKPDADGFRLPTPAEWAQAAGPEPQPDRAWLAANAEGTTHPVGTFKAGPNGLFDMFGNVWEFTWDPTAVVSDPAKPTPHRVLGLSFLGSGPVALTPRLSSPAVGFRIVTGPVEAAPQRPPAVPTLSIDPKSAPAPPKPDKVLTPADFVKIENGSYLRSDEATVTVSPFYIARTEVSFEDWRRVLAWAEATLGYAFDHDGDLGSMDFRTSEFAHSPDEPVTDIGWYDATLWCNALSELHGRTPVYYTDPEKTRVYRAALPWRIRMTHLQGAEHRNDRDDMPLYPKYEADGYRLPTWAEWQIAWRAGDTSLHAHRSPGSAIQASAEASWTDANSGGHTHPVRSGKANPSGIFNLGGNVSEWLYDTPRPDYYRAHNPRGDAASSLFGTAVAGAHFESEPRGVGIRPHPNRKSAAWPWLGFRPVRCDAGVNVEKPFVPKTVIEADAKDYDPLHGRTFRANSGRTGYFGPRGLDALQGVKWKFKTGGPVRSSPIATGDAVYFGSADHHLYALNAADGTLRWKSDLGAPVDHTPTLADGRVFIGTASGYLHALDPETGREIWKFAKDPSNPKRFPVQTSPAFAYGTVFAGFGRWGGHYSGIDARIGKELWRLRQGFTPNPGALAPAIVGTTFYAPVNDNVLVAVSIRTELPVARAPGHHCLTSVAVSPPWLLYSSGPSVVVLDSKSLERRYRADVKGGGLSFFPESGPALHDGIAYFIKGDHRLYALRLDAEGVTPLWDVAVPKRVRSSIAIAGDHLYFGCDDAHLYALERKTGKPAWGFKTGGPVASSPALEGGVLFVGSDDTHLYALH
jgi:formylglycine-generating enzyme required for sulfatase activity/outer membrane protein assembly factor BamB